MSWRTVLLFLGNYCLINVITNTCACLLFHVKVAAVKKVSVEATQLYASEG